MQRTRHNIQITFFVAIVVLVYIFRFNAEAYCPFGAVESLYAFLFEGRMLCALGSGNFFVLGIILLFTLLFRRIFCGYICPIGAVSELMRAVAEDLNYTQLKVPSNIDKGLSLIKYAMLFVVLILTAATMNLFYRKISPCYLFVSINNDIVFSTYVVGVIVLAGSFLISMPFCRWICPFAAVQNVISAFGLCKIKRNSSKCIDCGKCTKICPMNIDVANQTTINSANCISCLKCVDACPVEIDKKHKALQWMIFGKFNIKNPKAVITASILICVIAAGSASLLIDFPTFSYARDVPKPDVLEKAVLQVRGVSCSGSAQLFTYFLNRKDISEVDGYIKLATRPRSGWIDITIWYNPNQTDKTAIIEAVTEAYYDETEQRWRPSPFEVKGFNP